MCKVHVFVIISFFLSGKLIFLLKILKDLSNLHYKRKCETEIRNFFSLTFQWLQHDIYYAGGFKDPLKQDLALEFCRNQNKDFIVLTETHTNYDQIHHIRNNWLSPISTPPPPPPLKIVTQKDCRSSFIWVLKVSLKLTLIQDGD